MKKRLLIFMILIQPLFFSSVFAQSGSERQSVVVVANVNNPIDQLDKSEVIDIFMGRYVAFPNGVEAIPFELKDSHITKAYFYERLINRSITSVNAYWARLNFTGRQKKSTILDSEVEVSKAISITPNAIGYITRDNLTDDLKVIYTFDKF